MVSLCLATLLAVPAWSATYEFPSMQVLDNIEEVAADGTWDAGSSDLEIGYEKPGEEDQKQQIVGVRFPGVTIPEDETIVKAYIQFTQDEDKNLDPFSRHHLGRGFGRQPTPSCLQK